MKLSDLSWRIKVPLAILTVILATEVVVTTLLVSRALADARSDLIASSHSLTKLLARSLREPLLRDDLWQAFEVVSAPLAARRDDNPLRAIIVLDAAGQVFVASDPKSVPSLTPAAALAAPLADIAAKSAADARFRFDIGRGDDASAPELAAAAPVLSEDGGRLGTVILDFEGALYAERLRSAVLGVALVSVPGLLLLLPLGWYAGKRLAEPLAQMAQALSRVGEATPAEVARLLPSGGRDEIGRLATQARRMLDGLERKAALEREVLASERLAAVGRLSAGIAHEINNPLGGMLNAIDTAQRHGSPDPVTRKTLGLLERGLQQIQSTVRALLVEARLDSRRLSAQDWDDLLTLLRPAAAARGLRVDWRIEVDTPLDLPANDVRQLALNLLLNAAAAAQPVDAVEATIGFAVRGESGGLRLEVANSGPAPPGDRLARMFEPYAGDDGGRGDARRGLGLWVCWQIVQGLGGRIEAASDGRWTRVAALLPTSRPSAAQV
jgi:signal transduction histidine kinase